MASVMLGFFSHFCSLLSNVGKTALFDAVHPEINRYRELMFPGSGADEHYQTIMKEAFKAIGGRDSEFESGTDWSGRVADMRKRRRNSDEYRANIQYGYWFYYFSLFGDLAERDPYYGDRISERLFGECFYDRFDRDMRFLNIKRPQHLPPLEKAELGPITVFLGFDVGLETLQLPEFDRDDLLHDGEPAVLAALHWRARLSKRLGRDSEFDRILDWADNPNDEQAQVLLISGPAGVGKSRLAADVVSDLKNKRGWSGGLVPAIDLLNGVKLDGCGNGVALIIDYPEEYTDKVVEVLKSVAKLNTYKKPVRIILVSREEKVRWANILNETELPRIEEVRLGFSPYLTLEDAVSVARSVASIYPDLIDKPKPEFRRFEEWLSRAHSHRTPLSVLAASVHAVLDPDQAFELSDRDILLALADIELKRIRAYSSTNLNDPKALERLLALSLITPQGLSQQSVYDLGKNQLFADRNAVGFLEGVKSTPFWIGRDDEHPSRLLRLTPDLPAAAIFFRAFDLSDEECHPALPACLIACAQQAGDGFLEVMARVSLDLSVFGAQCSRILEDAAIKMLHSNGYLSSEMILAAGRPAPLCAKRFGLALCSTLLNGDVDKVPKLLILKNASELLADFGMYNDALSVNTEATRLLGDCFRRDDLDYRLIGAEVLGTRARILNGMGQRDDAVGASFSSLTLAIEASEADQSSWRCMAEALMSYSVALADVGDVGNATAVISKSIEMYRDNLIDASEKDRSTLADAFTHQATCFSEAGDFKEATESISNATALLEVLDAEYPDTHVEALGAALMNKSGWLSAINRDEEALQSAQEGIRAKQRLVDARPEYFTVNRAMAQNNLAIMLAKMGRHDEAVIKAEASISTPEDIAANGHGKHNLRLGAALNTKAACLLEAGSPYEAYPISVRAVANIDPGLSPISATEGQWIHNIVSCYFVICHAMGRPYDQELLNPIQDAEFFETIFGKYFGTT